MNSERTAQLQVALASYDLKELRVQKRYLQEQGTAIDCTCFCSGEKLLAQLRQGVRYDAVVLCSELTDLPAEQFVRQFYQLKERPMLLIQSHGRSSGTALQKLREGCYCVEGTELKRLLWQLYRMPGRQNRQLEQRGAASCMRRGASRRGMSTPDIYPARSASHAAPARSWRSARRSCRR